MDEQKVACVAVLSGKDWILDPTSEPPNNLGLLVSSSEFKSWFTRPNPGLIDPEMNAYYTGWRDAVNAVISALPRQIHLAGPTEPPKPADPPPNK